MLEPSYKAWYKTSRWQRLRARQLDEAPLCAMCRAEGVTTQATVCDHVERHRGDAIKFWSGPFQSLCAHHHNSHKQTLERGGTPIAARGVGRSGRPTSADHPWNRPKA